MAERGHVPLRTCVGCRQASPAAALVRFATVDGRVVCDPQRRAPGRGAWLHPDPACLERAVERRGFDRALHRAVTATTDDLIDCITVACPRNASTS